LTPIPGDTVQPGDQQVAVVEQVRQTLAIESASALPVVASNPILPRISK
tara:strand:- start:532 stop:678 length:147 start_codon:yes stop_codon:yes gene_type:complete